MSGQPSLACCALSSSWQTDTATLYSSTWFWRLCLSIRSGASLCLPPRSPKKASTLFLFRVGFCGVLLFVYMIFIFSLSAFYFIIGSLCGLVAGSENIPIILPLIASGYVLLRMSLWRRATPKWIPMSPEWRAGLLYGVLAVKPSKCGAFSWQIAIWCQLGALLATEPRLKQKALRGWRVICRSSDTGYYVLFTLKIKLSAKNKNKNWIFWLS